MYLVAVDLLDASGGPTDVLYLVAVDLLDASGGPTDVLSGCRSTRRKWRSY